MLDQIDFASSLVLLDGRNPFLLACEGGYFTVEKLALLLQRGASVHDRDRYGNTCLHLCQSLIGNRIKINRGKLSEIRDALIYLIQQGADIFAKNLGGESVSYTVYNDVDLPDKWHRRIREHVWECALANCGYGIYDFRPHARCATYSTLFTREHFEELWSGCEHLCPYYDDDEDALYLTDSSEDVWHDYEHVKRENDHGDDAMERYDSEDDGNDSEDGGVNLGPGYVT